MYKEQYVIDTDGNKIAVQVPYDIFQQLVADSEELDDIKEYRKAKKQKNDPVPFEQAFNEIESFER